MGKENGAVNWKRVLILAGAVIAFTIGSGFATGQEIIQYFTADRKSTRLNSSHKA